jgi:hypothetical protein
MESNGSMNIKVWLERLRERRPDLVDSGFFNNNDPDEVAANVYKSAARLSPIYTKSFPTGDNFNESDHPRDEDGKFGSGGGSSEKRTDFVNKSSELAHKMSELRQSQPRPIAKMYGSNGPTPEQHADWNEKNKKYNNQMSKLRKEHAIALKQDNEEYQRRKAKANDAELVVKDFLSKYV